MANAEKIRRAKVAHEKSLRDEVQMEIAELISAEKLPFQLVDSPYFKRIIDRIVEGGAPCRQTFSRVLLPKLHGLVNGCMAGALRLCDAISLDVDAWSQWGEEFLSVVATSVDSNLNTISYVLDFIHLEERHTGVYMAEKIREVLERPEFSHLRVLSGSSDNASNAVKVPIKIFLKF